MKPVIVDDRLFLVELNGEPMVPRPLDNGDRLPTTPGGTQLVGSHQSPDHRPAVRGANGRDARRQ
jgi:hypothetical protein